MKLYFNPQTAKQLDQLANKLPQAILLTGEEGVGLLTAAKHLANNQPAGIIEPRDKTDAVNHNSGTISVKRIRELYSEASSKSLTQRIFIIDDADKMSTGAQNAFLKLLEEPVASTHFILTSHQPNLLVATIKSRVEQLIVQPITAEQSQDMAFQLKLKGSKVAQALFVATGKPAELARLAADQDYFESTAGMMTAAKAFIGSSKSDAVEVAFKYAGDRYMTLKLLVASKKILAHTIKRQVDPELLAKLSKLNAAYDAIAANGNVKLQLVTVLL